MKNIFVFIEKKMSLSDNIKIYFDYYYNEGSDEEYSDHSDNFDEESSDRKIWMEKIRCINSSLDETRKIW